MYSAPPTTRAKKIRPVTLQSKTSVPFQALVGALPEPALVIAGGAVVASNAAARALFGDWIEGSDVRLAIRQPEALERLRGEIAGPHEIDLVGFGGHERRWTMTVAPLWDEALLVRLTDRSEAYAAERMRVDFVANASHELRTPLATLVGYAEILREQAELDPDTRQRFTGIIHDQALRMQRLVEDLISLSRIEGERFTALPELLELTDLMTIAAEASRQAASDRQCRLEIIAGDLPRIAGDRAQLMQLLDNLIGNAIRYGRAGGLITIRAEFEGGMVRLSVADQGEGIPSEHIPRLTERFYRVDPGRSRSQGGTGLGLSIVKHIVERHKGRLEIESRVGEGTTVTVRLPNALENES